MRLPRRARELNLRRMAAAAALFVLISFAPLLVGAIGVAGLVVGPEVAEAQVLQEVERLLGEGRAQGLRRAVESAAEPSASAWAAILSLAALFWSGSRLFFELERDLDEIWGQPVRQRQPGLRALFRTLRKRLTAMALVLGTGLLLMVAILARAVFTTFGARVSALLPGALSLEWLARDLWLFLIVVASLTVVYRLLPDPHPGWRPALGAGLAAGGLMTVGLLVISALLGMAGDQALLAAAVSPLVGIGGLYLGGILFFYGGLLCHELEMRRQRQGPM